MTNQQKVELAVTLFITTATKKITMKKLAILFAVIGLSLNVAIAENVKPVAKTNVKVKHNSFNLMKVAVKKVESETVKVKIYSSSLELLHTENMRKKDVKYFDISKLNAGFYLIKVEADGEMVYTEAIEKIK